MYLDEKQKIFMRYIVNFTYNQDQFANSWFSKNLIMIILQINLMISLWYNFVSEKIQKFIELIFPNLILSENAWHQNYIIN